MELPDTEFELLGLLYFNEPFDKIKEEINANPNIIRDAIRNLIAKKLVAPYTFNKEKNQFEQAFLYDSDNLEEYYFGATKAGIELYTKGQVDDE